LTSTGTVGTLRQGLIALPDLQAVFGITSYRNGMFGKRGEIPPLPRNCEARTFFGG